MAFVFVLSIAAAACWGIIHAKEYRNKIFYGGRGSGIFPIRSFYVDDGATTAPIFELFPVFGRVLFTLVDNDNDDDFDDYSGLRWL